MLQKIGDFYRQHKILTIFFILSLIIIIFLPIWFIIKIPILAILAVIFLVNLSFFKTFFKNHKIFAIISVPVFFIIMLFVLGLLFWAGKSIQVAMIDAPTERHYVDYMTGVVEPMSQMEISSKDIARLKEDNVNTLTIYPSTYLPSYLSFLYEFEKPYLIGVIKEAKKQGLAVRVSGQSGPTNIPDDKADEKFMEVVSKRVLEWAEISEDLGVEYFSPWTEVDTIGFQKAVDWHSEILPKVRQRFSGKVFAGWACCSSDDIFTEDFLPIEYRDEVYDKFEIGQPYGPTIGFIRRIEASKDFDGVMLDIPMAYFEEWQAKYFWDSSLPLQEGDDWRPDSLEDIVVITSQKAEEVGIPIYAGEFFLYPENSIGKSVTASNTKLYNANEMAEHYEIFFDQVALHYDGIIHCGLIFGPSAHFSIIEDVIKEKYGEVTS